jgi:hypothetical protein
MNTNDLPPYVHTARAIEHLAQARHHLSLAYPEDVEEELQQLAKFTEGIIALLTGAYESMGSMKQDYEQIED